MQINWKNVFGFMFLIGCIIGYFQLRHHGIYPGLIFLWLFPSPGHSEGYNIIFVCACLIAIVTIIDLVLKRKNRDC